MNFSKCGALIRKCCRNAGQLLGTCRDAGRSNDRDEAAAHRFYGLLERGEKRVARHAPHDRIRHEASRGRNFTAQRNGFELDVHTSIALFEPSDAIGDFHFRPQIWLSVHPVAIFLILQDAVFPLRSRLRARKPQLSRCQRIQQGKSCLARVYPVATGRPRRPPACSTTNSSPSGKPTIPATGSSFRGRRPEHPTARRPAR
jgi:hypothetical protein